MAQAYERLSTLDASFLALETRTTHMHVAAVSVFEAGPLRTAGGAIDIHRIRRFIESRLQYIPRYRQRLAWIPVEHHPVWIDDDHFNLDYHVRHTSLPQPGNDTQLKELAGRIISQQLDRQKPLWEMWVVEGLDDDRLAFLSKIHHSMIDGVAGAGLLTVLLNVAPTSDIEEPADWTPTPPPGDAELVAGEISRRLRDGIDRMRSTRRAIEDTRQFMGEGLRRARAVYYSLGSGWLRQAAATPLNDPIGPNRRFDWLETPLEKIKAIKAGLGGTVNDIVLATTAGAVREFLETDRDFHDFDIEFRAMAPVSVRSTSQQYQLGNQVAMWLVPLPIHEPDPVARLEAIKQETMRLKMTEQALGAQTIVAASGGAPHTLVSLGARLATSVRPFNLTVTNVPGPQFPMYLLEARLLAQYPVVPLFHRHGVGIALFSYDGTIAWGINADWDVVPDTGAVTASIQAALDELAGAASEGPRPSAPPSGAVSIPVESAEAEGSRTKGSRSPSAGKEAAPARASAEARKPASKGRTSTAKQPATTTKTSATKKPATTTKPTATKQPATTTKPTATKKPATTTKPTATKKPATTTKRTKPAG